LQSSTATVRWRGVISEADPAGDWPHRLAGRAAWRRHCPSGEGARRGALQWRRFGNGLTAALDVHVARVFIVTVTCASTRSEHGTPGPRRRQARSPAAAVPNTPGCHPDERLSSRPSAAGWSEAVRGTGVPRAAEGAVALRKAPRIAEGAVELQTSRAPRRVRSNLKRSRKDREATRVFSASGPAAPIHTELPCR
jgi:hypothetical protein